MKCNICELEYSSQDVKIVTIKAKGLTSTIVCCGGCEIDEEFEIVGVEAVKE